MTGDIQILGLLGQKLGQFLLRGRRREVQETAHHLQASALLDQPGGAANITMRCGRVQEAARVFIYAQRQQSGLKRGQPCVLVHQPLNEKRGVGASSVGPK